MSQRTHSAEQAVDLCRNWAGKLESEVQVSTFLFGSAIYQDGLQFDPVRSDLDIVCLISDDVKSAVDRWALTKSILQAKHELELSMIAALGRTTCDEPGVSIIPLTSTELKGDVHKSGVGNFFRSNAFLNLRTGKEDFGIEGAGSVLIDPKAFQAMAYTQSVRNRYLSVAANKVGGLRPFDGHDPLPKGLLRSAAQLSNDTVRGQYFDVRFGLEEMHRILQARRSESPAISELFDQKVSIRRGGRGVSSPLDADDQLLLAEILFDSSLAVERSMTVTWDLKVVSKSLSASVLEVIFNRVKALVPSAQPIGNWASTGVLRVMSSAPGLEMFQLLGRHDLLGEALKVDEAKVISVGSGNTSVQSAKYEDRRLSGVLQAIGEWAPKASLESEAEIELREVVRNAIDRFQLSADGYSMQTNPNVALTPMKSARFDLLLVWFAGANSPELSVPIELKRFQGPSTVPQILERYYDSSKTTILIVYGIPQSRMHEVQAQASRSKAINANLLFVLRPES